MNENIIVLILADQTFSRLTHAYCVMKDIAFPMTALYEVHGKITPGEDDMNTVYVMIQYMKDEMVGILVAP